MYYIQKKRQKKVPQGTILEAGLNQTPCLHGNYFAILATAEAKKSRIKTTVGGRNIELRRSE